MESETRARLRRALTERPDSKWAVTYRDDLQCALDALDAAERETARAHTALSAIVATMPAMGHVAIKTAAGSAHYALVPLALIEQAKTVLQPRGGEEEQ